MTAGPGQMGNQKFPNLPAKDLALLRIQAYQVLVAMDILQYTHRQHDLTFFFYVI